MLGFVPGFAYMGRVDPAIAAPRHRVPRERVPAGSVGIAGGQTGVYPVDSPGGWQLIGRTTTVMFDANRATPSLLAPGDLVRFVALPRCMSTGALVVVKPGLLTTVQDLGRFGHQASGVPVAGPMDAFSHRLANQLVGNDPAAAALEITLIGPELMVEADTTMAITGAHFDVTCDDRSVPMGASFGVRAGSRLKFGRIHQGARAYLAVAGGVQTPPVLGSRATHLVSRMGGLSGRALIAGDRIPIATGASPRPHRKSAGLTLPSKGRALLRVLPGPQDHWFAPDALKTMTSVSFRISPRSNRMGYRLEGPPLPRVKDGELISEPVGHRRDPGAGRGRADSADGRSADRRWLSEDRPRDFGGPAAGRPTCARGLHRVRDLFATGSRGGADRARTAVAALRRPEGRVVSDVAVTLEQKFGADRVRRNVPLAPMTTFKVGGPADLFLETQSEAEIIEAVKIAHAAGVKVTLLGGGSNVLVADGGIRGLVIRPKGGTRRHRSAIGCVRVDAAVTINGLVRWTINRGYAGLEAWAGTPGHGGRRHLRQRALEEHQHR